MGKIKFKKGQIFGQWTLTSYLGSGGNYTTFEYLEDSYYTEQNDLEFQRPKDMQYITRLFRGSFVIFNKRSPYNILPSTYDARHNKMTTEEFRSYIQKGVDAFKREDEKKTIFEKIRGNKNSKRKIKNF